MYPGTCAKLPPGSPPPPGKEGRQPALRFRVEPGLERFVDEVHREQQQDVAAAVGDFVVRRSDGVAAYQLAVVVDDAAAGVNHVLRADDLVGSTFRQLQLYRALGEPPPSYAHVPLMMDETGKRMAKRSGALTVRAQREAGKTAEELVGHLAGSIGLGDGRPGAARALIGGFSLSKLKQSL